MAIEVMDTKKVVEAVQDAVEQAWRHPGRIDPDS